MTIPPTDQLDLIAIENLVARERAARDGLRWAEMGDYYHPESTVDISWFKGSGAEFTSAIAFSHLRRLLPPVLSGVVAMTLRLAAALFAEIAANLQKFMPHRNRHRPIRPKPHKSHAYKPCL